MNELLGSRRKTYILDVIGNKFYFGEVQEEILVQCSGQGIYLSTYNRRSICLSVVCSSKNKKGGRGNAFLNTPLKLDLSWIF